MIRHLLYDCCALRGTGPQQDWIDSAAWLDNVNTLCRYAGTFTGRKVVVLRVDENTLPPEEVKPAFARLGAVEFVERANCPFPGLREADHFIDHLSMLRPTSAGEAIFFAHTKGVSRSPQSVAIKRWRDLMYEKCLSNPQAVDEALARSATCGCFRRMGAPAGCPGSRWHFSGTFWWMNSDRLFSLPNWDQVPSTPYAVEGYPGIMFEHRESACLYEDNPPYDLYAIEKQWRCENCGHEFYARHGFKDRPLKACRKCFKRRAVVVRN